jgi:hypothetical protein
MHVLFDEILLKEVVTWVTRISNKVIPLVFLICILLQLQFYLLNDKSLCYLNMSKYMSSLKQVLLKFRSVLA